MNARGSAFFCLATQAQSRDLPSPTLALTEPNGLLAAGGDLAPDTLLRAYRAGIFPWFSPDQPILWWSPDPRAVIVPANFHASRRLQRSLRRARWQVSVNFAFEQVIRACAAPRDHAGGTWLTPEMIAAYLALHHRGHAHSVECWLDDRLAGGVYGVDVGDVFCGESMFSHVTNGSKVALYALCQRLQTWGYQLLDCQIENPHLLSLGAQRMSRREFCDRLAAAPNVARADWRPSAPADWPI